MHRLISFGYTGARFADLKSLVDAGAIVVDTRFSPASRVPIWRKEYLESAFGPLYVHMRQLGNRNYRGGPIDIVDLLTGLRGLEYLLEHRDVVLMCVCRELADCHRSLVLDAARERWPEVEIVHWSPAPAPEYQGRLL